MAFAIMRCKKLKTAANLASSLQHNYRERQTDNADPERTGDNIHMCADNTDKAMGNWRARMPEKRRKDAVVAVEYMMTASPEWFEKADERQREAFYKACVDWVAEKYGKDNVIACSVHLDEKTPHVAAYVTPITADGRLSAKEFIGNKKQMSLDQDSFHEAVKEMGLQRGIRGSKAKHQSVQRFYELVNKAERIVQVQPSDVERKPIKKGIFTTTWESDDDITKRINERLRPFYATAMVYHDAKKERETALQGLERAEKEAERQRNRANQYMDELSTTKKATTVLKQTIEGMRSVMTEEQKREAVEKVQKSVKKSRGFER